MSFMYTAIGIALLLSIAATTVSTISAYQQGKAQEDMYQAEANMAAKQAEIAEEEAQMEAELAQDQAAAESKKLRRHQIQRAGQEQAILGAMGISGVTEEDVIADRTKIDNEDKATLRWNADVATWEAETTVDYQSWQFRSQAELANASARSTRRSTRMNLTAGILDIGSQVVGGVGMAAGLKTGKLKIGDVA